VKRNLLSFLLSVFLAVPFLLGGCVGLQFTVTDVAFEDPYERLGIISVDPNDEETHGVLLRFKPPPDRKTHLRGETILFARIKEGRGARARIVMNEIRTYEPGSREDSYRQLSLTTFEKQKGTLVEELEVTERGEIIQFIRSLHTSSLGAFDITEWSRSPMLPEGYVRVGDSWRYGETMNIHMKSKWVKDLDPTPFQINATSTLEGFAVVGGRRTAMIKTRVLKTRRENLKVLWKTLTLDVQMQIEEITFLDYKAGTVLAQIIDTQNFTSGVNVPFADQGQSRTVMFDVDLVKEDTHERRTD